MSLRILSLAPPLVSFFFLSTFVVAQIVAPTCNSTAAWQWTFNSLGQSPCTVLVYMMSTCNGGKFSLWQLQPTWVYLGPNGDDNANLCMCSTVGYSLFSACGACQGTDWMKWSQWVTNCTKTLPPSSFPNPVPSQIRVPQWVLLDVTNENFWNANNKSYLVGDSPELGPGAILGPSGVSTSSSTSPTRSPTPPGNHKSNTGAIVGGVVGGVTAISIAVAVVFYLRRRRSQAASAGVGASQPILNGGTVTQPSSGLPLTMKFYNPNDPTTFPGYQGDPGSVDIPSASQVPLPSESHVGSGATLTTMQTSSQSPKRYHGFPMPT